jgi:uncharacterized protein (TIGR00255 family)
MIRIRNNHRTGAAAIGCINGRAFVARILHNTLDGCRIRADNGDHTVRIDHVTVSTICRFPDVLTQTAAPADPDTLWADVEQVAQQAVAAFVSMRAVEGEKLRTDVLNRLAAIETLVAQIEQNSAGRVQAYTERLYTRLKELLEDRNIDDARIVTEAAIFADKTAIDEETVRLHSHVAQYRSILELDEPVGRKLDFLTQELNRESNTIGSKCQDINITRLVVELKSEIEKIREQIQNIE